MPNEGLVVELQISSKEADRQLANWIKEKEKQLNKMAGINPLTGNRNRVSSGGIDRELDRNLRDRARQTEQAQKQHHAMLAREEQSRAQKIKQHNREFEENTVRSYERTRARVVAILRGESREIINEIRRRETERVAIEQREGRIAAGQRRGDARHTINRILEQERAAGRMAPGSVKELISGNNSLAKSGSRATVVMFQLQQAVEDASFAMQNGRLNIAAFSNNIAFLAAMMGGSAGIIALLGLMGVGVGQLAFRLAQWASGSEEARRKSAELTDQVLRQAEAIERARMGFIPAATTAKEIRDNRVSLINDERRLDIKRKITDELVRELNALERLAKSQKAIDVLEVEAKLFGEVRVGDRLDAERRALAGLQENFRQEFGREAPVDAAVAAGQFAKHLNERLDTEIDITRELHERKRLQQDDEKRLARLEPLERARTEFEREISRERLSTGSALQRQIETKRELLRQVVEEAESLAENAKTEAEILELRKATLPVIQQIQNELDKLIELDKADKDTIDAKVKARREELAVAKQNASELKSQIAEQERAADQASKQRADLGFAKGTTLFDIQRKFSHDAMEFMADRAVHRNISMATRPGAPIPPGFQSMNEYVDFIEATTRAQFGQASHAMDARMLEDRGKFLWERGQDARASGNMDEARRNLDELARLQTEVAMNDPNPMRRLAAMKALERTIQALDQTFAQEQGMAEAKRQELLNSQDALRIAIDRLTAAIERLGIEKKGGGGKPTLPGGDGPVEAPKPMVPNGKEFDEIWHRDIVPRIRKRFEAQGARFEEGPDGGRLIPRDAEQHRQITDALEAERARLRQRFQDRDLAGKPVDAPRPDRDALEAERTRLQDELRGLHDRATSVKGARDQQREDFKRLPVRSDEFAQLKDNMKITEQALLELNAKELTVIQQLMIIAAKLDRPNVNNITNIINSLSAGASIGGMMPGMPGLGQLPGRVLPGFMPQGFGSPGGLTQVLNGPISIQAGQLANTAGMLGALAGQNSFAALGFGLSPVAGRML